MQLTKLIINEFRHLHNLTLDFTYPEGHDKAGKPLEKICFIGQSATGKTSILELLKENLILLSQAEIVNNTELLSYNGVNFNGQIEFQYEGSPMIVKKGEVIKNNRLYEQPFSGGGTVSPFLHHLRSLFLGSEIISKTVIETLNKNPLTFTEFKIPRKASFNSVKYNLEFPSDKTEELWLELLSEVLEYRRKFTQLASELINRGSIGDLKKVHKQVEKWQDDNKNPLQNFANYFNPILNNLLLEVDLINTEYFLPIKSRITDEVIPVTGLSTGTKSLLISLFPLFQLDTADAIIMVDEPERSLFPDLQIDLLSHYRKLAPEAQLLFATHSPFIASSFEPEERFILYFNDEGKVSVRRGKSPIGDDPNDILVNDFQVDYYNEFGKKAYQQYVDLKRQVKEETDPNKKRNLATGLAELGDKYNF